MKFRIVTPSLLGAMLVIAAPQVHAQGKARPAASVPVPVPVPVTEPLPLPGDAAPLKNAADLRMDQDRYADAIVLYQRAYDLSSDPTLLYNLGRALEALGDYPAALERLERFERDAPSSVRARVPGLRELITDLRGRIATLVVKTNAPNARLLVRKKDEGALGAEKRLLTRAGSASVEVEAEGYEPFRRDVDLSAGTMVVVDANLVQKKREPLLSVTAKPNALVYIDGKPIGRAPLQVRVSPGSHEFVARSDGYYDEKIPMVLATGDERVVDLHLRPVPSIAGRWWFWAGLGVVVAGGVATAVALTTERPHDGGSFNPGSVPGP